MSAQFPVQLPSGEFAELVSDECIRTHQGDIPLPVGSDGKPFDVLYLDITTVNGFAICGQAQQEPSSPSRGTWCWFADEREWVHVSEQAPGAYPVMFDAQGRLRIATPEHNGSQGWRYVSESGECVTGDATLNQARWNEAGRQPRIETLWEFAYLGGVFIGQGETGCDVLIDGARRRLLDGDTRNIRVKYDGEKWGVSLMRFREGDSFRKVFTRAELEALPITQNDIVITQPPETPEPKMPESLLSLVQQVYARRQPRTTDAYAAVLNEVAWLANGQRPDGEWGLSAKPDGHFARQPSTGTRVAYDILHHRASRTLWDALGPSEDPQPLWGEATWHGRDEDRPWVAPVRPVGSGPESPKPPETPEQPSSLNIGPAVQALIDAAVAAAEKRLTARIEALETPPAPPSGRFTATIQSANGRYLRHDWADDLPRFDRDTAGSGERYTVTLEPIE